MPNERLDHKTFKTAGPSLILQVLSKGIQLLVGILMLRLLEPKDYGIWGILVIFWTLGNIFLWGGFGTALTQKKEINKQDLDSVFYYNMVVAVFCALLLFLCSGWLADFFDQPVLKPVMNVILWIFPISAAGAIQYILLNRQLKQDLVNLAIFVGQIVAIPPTLYIAWKGYGVWALAWQLFIAQSVSTIMVFCFCHWFPGLNFNFKALGALFKFGSNILFAGLLISLFTNIYNFVIGKIYPIATLGYYERGRQYAAIWPESVQATIGSVLFSAFSKIQDDVPRLRNAVIESLKMSFFITFFPSLMIAALAVPFVTIVFSEKWLPIVPYMQVLTLGCMLLPFHWLNLQILNARGRSGVFLGLIALDKLFVIISILCTVWFSVLAMVWGMVVVSCVSLYFNTRYTKRVLGYGLRAQIWDALPYVVYSLISSGSAWGLYRLLWPVNQWLGLFVPMVAGCLMYFLLNIFCYSPAFDTAWRLLKEQFKERQKKEERVEF